MPGHGHLPPHRFKFILPFDSTWSELLTASLNADPALEPSHRVDVAKIADVSKVYADSIFRTEMNWLYVKMYICVYMKTQSPYPHLP